MATPPGTPFTRRLLLHAALAGLSGDWPSARAEPVAELGHSDLSIDGATALLYSAQAPLAPTDGHRDAQAVWARVPPQPDRTVLVYLHGHNNYVTVDAGGKSRVPDWATTEAARGGASAKQAAPLAYGLHHLGPERAGKSPVVLVPEVSRLASGSFWAVEPAGQYAHPARLGKLTADCLQHLAGLRGPTGAPYLAEAFLQRALPEPEKPSLDRFYLCGHSGAGIPLEEAAVSALLLPATGTPTELWLFDCTYWNRIDGFVRFCEEWAARKRLAGSNPKAARLVCVYRARSQTEAVADKLRGEAARLLHVDAASLVRDHTATNFAEEIRPALKNSGALFLRTHLPHDEIPTFFIPALLQTAAN
jgi:hypothetical protein